MDLSSNFSLPCPAVPDRKEPVDFWLYKKCGEIVNLWRTVVGFLWQKGKLVLAIITMLQLLSKSKRWRGGNFEYVQANIQRAGSFR